MAKLTRRKRNELKNNPGKQNKKEISKMGKTEQRVPKKETCLYLP